MRRIASAAWLHADGLHRRLADVAGDLVGDPRPEVRPADPRDELARLVEEPAEADLRRVRRPRTGRRRRCSRCR